MLFISLIYVRNNGIGSILYDRSYRARLLAWERIDEFAWIIQVSPKSLFLILTLEQGIQFKLFFCVRTQQEDRNKHVLWERYRGSHQPDSASSATWYWMIGRTNLSYYFLTVINLNSASTNADKGVYLTLTPISRIYARFRSVTLKLCFSLAPHSATKVLIGVGTCKKG